MVDIPRIIRSVVTLGFAASYIFMLLTSMAVPTEFYGLLGFTIGFYFKET